MQWDLWLAFVGAALAISVSPGAGAIQSMATGLTHGLRRGAWSVAGLQIGLMTQLAVVAVGLGAAVAKSVLAFTVIKWIGVLYLIYLAVRQWRTTADDLTDRVAVDAGTAQAVDSHCCCGGCWSTSPTRRAWCSCSPSCRSSWC